ncbi:MAG: hypothetical protein F6K21_03275 [Symploca sp. SIO2D2]|nr:hypothetical protein [Symploca sp. SIO2D2]
MIHSIDASSETFEDWTQAEIVEPAKVTHTCQPLFYYLQNESTEWMVENFGGFLEQLPVSHKYMILSAIAIKGMEESEQGDQYSMPQVFWTNDYSFQTFDGKEFQECDYNEDMVAALDECSTQELLQLSTFLVEDLQDYGE